MPLLVMTVIAKAIPRPSDQSAVAVDQHAIARERRIDDRDLDFAVHAPAVAQPLCGRDLPTVVKLGFDAGDQLVGQVANPIRRAASTRRSSCRATHANTAESRRTISSRPGRWTLTITERPSCNLARWV